MKQTNPDLVDVEEDVDRIGWVSWLEHPYTKKLFAALREEATQACFRAAGLAEASRNDPKPEHDKLIAARTLIKTIEKYGNRNKYPYPKPVRDSAGSGTD